MVDFSTQAQAKELAPPASRGEAQSEVAAIKYRSASPLLTTDGVDMMYHQLAKIHTIAAAPLAECARWHWNGSTPHSTRVGASPLSPAWGHPRQT
jgi:hypothetical protein